MASRIERIEQMERCLDDSRNAIDRLEEAMNAYESVLGDYQKLCAYYGSEQWMKDFAADEAGKLPADLKRGILSEDAVYDLLAENKELTVRMLKAVQANIEKQ